jgi:RNA polymerase sigma-70 factor, ECF subfamily
VGEALAVEPFPSERISPAHPDVYRKSLFSETNDETTVNTLSPSIGGTTQRLTSRARGALTPSLRPTDDRETELITAIRRGQSDACTTLVRTYGRLVHRVAADILRDSGEAEDVTQEVFLQVFSHADRYDATRGTVKVWILQYAYHHTLRRKETLRKRAAYGGASLDEVDRTVGCSRRQLSRQERRWVIRAGLAQLPERQRTTIELACFEELSLQDIAERLSVSLGCARHYYYRGLARLKAWAAGHATPISHDATR